MNMESCKQPYNQIMNTKETVVPELAKCYLRLMELHGVKNDRISGLVPLDCEGRLAVSIVEREYSGSESFAVFIYELAEPEGVKQDCFECEMIDGRKANVRLVDMMFSSRCNYDTLHELCAMIDVSLEEHNAADIFCNR